MISLAVCEDEPDCAEQALALAHSFFKSHGLKAEVDAYPDAEALLAAGKRYGIYLLDIFMPGKTGIELAEELRQSDPDCMIVYLTSSDEFALNAYQVGALQYLLKPIDPAVFQETMERAVWLLARDAPPTLPIPTPKGTVALSLPQVVYIEHYEKVLNAHIRDGSVVQTSTAALTLNEIAPQVLACPDFLPVGRAYLVNMAFIESFGSNTVTMAGGAAIPITRRGYREAKGRYMKYLLEKRRV